MSNGDLPVKFLPVKFLIAVGIVVQMAWTGPVLAQGTSGGTAGGGAAGGGAASGGALGSSAAAPGTNSAGTAAPSGGSASGGSVATGTGDPTIDKDAKQVDKKIKSICKGC